MPFFVEILKMNDKKRHGGVKSMGAPISTTSKIFGQKVVFIHCRAYIVGSPVVLSIGPLYTFLTLSHFTT